MGKEIHMKTRTITRATAWRLLARIGASLDELRSKGEIKISRHVFLSIHKRGEDQWIYLLRSGPELKPSAPRLHPVFRHICTGLVTLSA